MKRLTTVVTLFVFMLFHPAARCDEADGLARLTELGADVKQTNGVATAIMFKDCSKLQEADFRLIGEVKTLKSLTLHGQCKGLNDKTLAHIAGLTNLEELSTDGIQVTDQGLIQLTSLTSIRSLKFFHPSYGMKGFDGHGFACLKSLPKLERLTIAGSPFNDKGMAAVAEITQLREFRTWHTYQTQAGNESLLQLKDLKTVWLGQRLRQYDGRSNEVSLDDSTIEILLRMKSLETITLDEARLSADQVIRLRELPHLKKIVLTRIEIPGADVDVIKRGLEPVKVDWTPLTDEERSKLNAFLKK